MNKYTRNVQGTPVELTLTDVDPNEVGLDTTNPRLRYSIAQLAEGMRSDAACQLLLTSQDETESLRRSILLSGGIQEPIYVRSDGRVAEGNRRVVAMRGLHEEYPTDSRFGTMPAWLIPEDIPESVVADLLNEIHLGSVRGWAPYEKACQMRALVRQGGLIEDEVAERYRMTTREVRQYIAAVDFMDELFFPITTDRTDPAHRSKFSYFLEYYKSGKLQKHEAENNELPRQFARWVNDEKINTGAKVRRLAKVLDSKQATIVLDTSGFDAAIEHLNKESPHKRELYVHLEQARIRLSKMTVEEFFEIRDNSDLQDILRDLYSEVGSKLTELDKAAGKS